MDPFTTMELLPAFQQVGQFWTLEDLKSLLTNSGELVRLVGEEEQQQQALLAFLTSRIEEKLKFSTLSLIH